MLTNNPPFSCFDAGQGRDEQRSKAYIKYGVRAAQFLTQSCAKSASRLIGSADEQAGAVRKWCNEK